MTAAVKPKKIVVFSANGGIGKSTVEEIVRQMSLPGNKNQPVEIWLLARAGEKGENRAKGIAMDLRDQMALDNGLDLRTCLSEEHAIIWDPAKIDSAKDALADADCIILPGGLPRKKKPDGSFPERSELIAPNLEMLEPMAEAIAKHAPVKAPVVICTNPLDNMVTGVEEICRKFWEKNHITEDIPKFKAIGMGGTLDEARFKIALADRLSDIQRTFDSSKPNILPSKIGAVIYGQHGPTMAVDREGITVDGESLDDFLAKYPNFQKKDILDAAEKETRGKGAKIGELLGNTSQEPPAARLGEILAAIIFGKEPHTLTASVSYQLDGETRPIASGCQIQVSQDGIERVPYNCTGETTAKIRASRKAIIADHASHELVSVLPTCGDIAQERSGDKTLVKISAKTKDAEGEGILGSVANLIAQAFQFGEANKPIVNEETLSFNLDSKQLTTFQNIAQLPGFAQTVKNRVRQLPLASWKL